MPVDYWLSVCDRARTDVNMYSDDFVQTFERSDFFSSCKKSVDGKLQWQEWSECNVLCGGGIQTKIASSCVPDYAVCHGIPILERTCNEHVCPIGQWTWNDWSECSETCGGGIKIKTAKECSPNGASCEDIPIIKESCNTEDCPRGHWSWKEWGDCSVSCGGGVRTRIPKACEPSNAICHDVPILEESCNSSSCPDIPPQYLPARV